MTNVACLQGPVQSPFSLYLQLQRFPTGQGTGSLTLRGASDIESDLLVSIPDALEIFLSPCLCSWGFFLSEVQIHTHTDTHTHTHTLSLLGPVLPGFSCSVDFVLLGSTFVNQIVNAF